MPQSQLSQTHGPPEQQPQWVAQQAQQEAPAVEADSADSFGAPNHVAATSVSVANRAVNVVDMASILSEWK